MKGEKEEEILITIIILLVVIDALMVVKADANVCRLEVALQVRRYRFTHLQAPVFHATRK